MVGPPVALDDRVALAVVTPDALSRVPHLVERAAGGGLVDCVVYGVEVIIFSHNAVVMLLHDRSIFSNSPF